MKFSSESLDLATKKLLTRKAVALSICKWCMMGSVVWAGGYCSTQKDADTFGAVLILLFGFVVVPAIYGVFAWMNDFLFIRNVFTEILVFLELRIGGFGESPTLRRSAYRMYGTFKALVILFKERWITSWLLVLVCAFSIQFIVPAIILGYLIWIRFFCIDKFARTEREFLQAYESSSAIKAVFGVESTETFNTLLDMLIQYSASAA